MNSGTVECQKKVLMLAILQGDTFVEILFWGFVLLLLKCNMNISKKWNVYDDVFEICF